MNRDAIEIRDIDGRPTIVLERTFAHPVERVWRAVADEAENTNWFVCAMPWTPAVGERFEAHGEPVEVTAVEAPHRVEWSWGSELYAIALTATDAGGTHLRFEHAFDAKWGPGEQHAAGWDIYVGRLHSLLAGIVVDEHDAHRQGVPRTIDGEEAVVFHRSFPQSAERLWEAVSTLEGLRAWFPHIVDIEPRTGGQVSFDFGDGAVHHEVLLFDPPRELRLDWGGDEVRLRVMPLDMEGKRSSLSLTNILSEQGSSARNAAGWHVCLDALERAVADVAADPVETGATSEWASHYANYQARDFPASAIIPH